MRLYCAYLLIFNVISLVYVYILKSCSICVWEIGLSAAVCCTFVCLFTPHQCWRWLKHLFGCVCAVQSCICRCCFMKAIYPIVTVLVLNVPALIELWNAAMKS